MKFTSELAAKLLYSFHAVKANQMQTIKHPSLPISSQTYLYISL